MKVVIQRVARATVSVAGAEVGRIGPGLLLLAAIEAGDGEADVQRAAEKIVHLRIFPGEGEAAATMDRSVLERGGAVLVVSQFTLAGSIRKGRRPSFDGAAPPALARPLVDRFAEALRALGAPVSTGVFGAMMQVELVNDGPVTFILDSAP